MYKCAYDYTWSGYIEIGVLKEQGPMYVDQGCQLYLTQNTTKGENIPNVH
jgi:hypothetical protein